MTKEQALVKLYELIDFYYENRDLPVSPEFNFFEQIEESCRVLDVDYETVLKEFNLKSL
ncbi:hypothetical protein [Corticicoccus populi]|uniref:Uncharacterized protein n=1 Tax=Corticicoccus populi TaxID=1812821 RepID=A0ABW5WQA4_9STAP